MPARSISAMRAIRFPLMFARVSLPSACGPREAHANRARASDEDDGLRFVNLPFCNEPPAGCREARSSARGSFIIGGPASSAATLPQFPGCCRLADDCRPGFSQSADMDQAMPFRAIANWWKNRRRRTLEAAVGAPRSPDDLADRAMRAFDAAKRYKS